MVAFALVFLAFGMAVVTDIRKKEIPSSSLWLLLLAAVVFVVGYGQSLLERIRSFLVIGGLVLALSLWRDGLGGGDVKLIALTALALGWYPTLGMIFLGLPAATLALGLKNKRTKEKNAIALAPYLSLGLLAFFLCDRLILS